MFFLFSCGDIDDFGAALTIYREIGVESGSDVKRTLRQLRKVFRELYKHTRQSGHAGPSG
jgi:hypothetical protein